jgi:hypothetical protein
VTSLRRHATGLPRSRNFRCENLCGWPSQRRGKDRLIVTGSVCRIRRCHGCSITPVEWQTSRGNNCCGRRAIVQMFDRRRCCAAMVGSTPRPCGSIEASSLPTRRFGNGQRPFDRRIWSVRHSGESALRRAFTRFVFYDRHGQIYPHVVLSSGALRLMR